MAHRLRISASTPSGLVATNCPLRSPCSWGQRTHRALSDVRSTVIFEGGWIVSDGRTLLQGTWSTSVSEALFGPVVSQPQESSGPGLRPGRPAIALPEYYGINGEPFLSGKPDPSGASHPAISKYQTVTAMAAALAATAVALLPASVAPGPRPGRPGVGPPGYCSVSVGWFVPWRFGSRHHRQTLARPSLHVAFIISERSAAAKA
jgi:hypothetical protein